MKNACALVLIIDNNRVSNFFNKNSIENTGMFKKVITMDNSEIAYGFINSKKTINQLPCIIFLDLYMPNMNGWEFLDKFSTHDKADESVFVIMSNRDLIPEEKMKLNQYPFVKSMIHKNITTDFVTNLCEEIYSNHKEISKTSSPALSKLTK